MAQDQGAGTQLTAAVMGLGEAGTEIAAGLVAHGHAVRGYDPAASEEPGGVLRAFTPEHAVRGADVVLVLVAAEVAREVATSVAHALVPGAIYADCCSAAPDVKRSVATTVEGAGASFVDVALLAPVPGRGPATPTLLSGGGAERFAKAFHPLGLAGEVVSSTPGDAAARKLLRSVFMKGLAAALLEALDGAQAMECGDWLRNNVAAELERADAALVERLIAGSRTHAARRVEEMTAAGRLLSDLSVDAEVTRAATARLQRLAEAPTTATETHGRTYGSGEPSDSSRQ